MAIEIKRSGNNNINEDELYAIFVDIINNIKEEETND